MLYVDIDGHTHKEVQAADGGIATECGLEVPYAAPWTDREPVDALCPKCFPDAPKKLTKKAT